ncbi:TPA: YggL family protein [Vibrio parahaemolyticus]|nr:YggL family protein [Vibrio parahaemolyticus]
MAKNRSRRLRKKLFIGEFTVYGFEVTCRMTEQSNTNYNQFIDEFIDLVEDQNLIFGAGASLGKFDCFVMSDGRYDSPTDQDRLVIENWLSNNPIISEVKVGELVDANNGVARRLK